MKRKELVEMMNNMKVCIDLGHDYKFVESLGMNIEWICRRCGDEKISGVTEEQDRILREHRNMKPEKAE